MSFSGQIKEELSRQEGHARHCRIAELAAMITMCGAVRISSEDQVLLLVQTETLAVARKYEQLLTKLFSVSCQVRARSGQRGKRRGVIYTVVVPSHEEALRVLTATGLYHGGWEIEALTPEHGSVLQRTCCQRAFLRGAFLSSGSVSDPKKSYHFELVCASLEMAERLADLIGRFSLDARVVARKSHFVVYLKEGAQIVDMLGVMEAPKALMDMENVRILREISNTVNRKVNCETANLGKTVSASVHQTEEIRRLEATIGLDSLPAPLRQTARLRLDNPDLPLRELGLLHDPPVGKSGVNHRLRKLGELSRKQEEKIIDA